LEEARSYLDLDDIEDTFVQTSVQKAVERENRQKRNTRLWLIGLTVLTIGFAISTIFTIAANVAAQKANRENVQLIERDKQRKLAEAELRLEQLQSTLAALTELKATLNQKLSPHETSEQQQVITKSIQDATQTINKAAKKQDEQAKTLAVTSAAKGSDKGWQNGTIAILDPQNDPRLKPDETLALVTTWKEANRFSPPIFKSNDGSRRPLVRNLDPNANWVASRWNYAITPRAWLLANKVTVRNPTTGKQVQAQPVDWGPSAGSGAIMNVSPGLAQFLGLANGGTADLLIPIPQLTK
jgi:hypothetical protein